MSLDDDKSTESGIRIYWELLDTLECIGSSLDPQVYLPHLSKVLPDVQEEIYAAFGEVLEKLELPLTPTESLHLNPIQDKETSICLRARTSSRRKQKLRLHFKDKRLWEPDLDPEQWVPFKGNPLSSYLWGPEKAPADEANSGAFTNQSRAEIPVLLAHSMLYLYKTPWFQHLWDMEQLFLWTGREGLLQDQYPYLACALSMSKSRDATKSIFNLNEEACDPLYRHSLVLEFGMRILEIESGRRFPPDQDVDPEGDDTVTLPYLTLQRALQSLNGRGVVEDVYYDVAKTCLDFDRNLKKHKFQEVEAGLREWVVLHNLIFSPLLQLLAKKFKGAAADLLELELATQNNKPKAAAVQSRSQPIRAKAARRPELNEHGLTTIAEQRHIPAVKSPLSIVVIPSGSDVINPPDIERSPSNMKKEHVEFEDGTPLPSPRIATTLGGIRLFDDYNDTLDQSIRNHADEFLTKLAAFRKRYIKPSKGRQRMRIAILDTGVDDADLFLRKRRESLSRMRDEAGYGPEDDPIKAIETFLGRSAMDNNGHGTMIAGILTEVVPEADLYIAKIADGMHVGDLCHIPDAIDWARGKRCDIITMSFGIEQSAEPQEGFNEIGKAINRAYDAGILMFAAASNCGANGSRTYPAWDGRVICVHALDGRGSPYGSVNPSVEDYPGDNFGTLGVGVKCRWRKKIMYKTGTSFATPVAAGIAALVLEYMDQSYSAKEVDRERHETFRNCRGMQQLFRKFMSKEMGNCGYRFVAPWIFWAPGLCEDRDIWSALRTNLKMVKTYIPTPNFSTAPPPNGPLDLGHIIEDLSYSSIESPLNEEGYVEIACRFQPDKKTGFRKTRKELLSGEFGIFAKFLALFGVGVEAETNFEKGDDNVLAVDTLETITFAPKMDYIEKSMEADGVRTYMEACEYKGPVFMVTGMKIARGASMESTHSRGFGWKFSLGFSHPGVPADLGPKAGMTKTRAEGESYDESTDFILAIRVRKIRYRAGELATAEHNKGATMMDDITKQRYTVELEDLGDDIGLEDVPGGKDMELAESNEYDGDEPSYLAIPKGY
ncbi:thioredoxin [Purpureocillium lavendulum]|uniref:Thioredoxin n=1 Tax=Purpureocillium lavendulum TaxID=1247861 RepID=A0AB34FEY6_9HYPO|nr:thioredoxin [Purpureocillium lavendulum]